MFTNGQIFMKEYIHALPGTEIMYSSGSYIVKAEGRLKYENREMLYIEGMTIVGSACCGAIECRIIHIPGLIVSWRHKVDKNSGNSISEVEPVMDTSTREDMMQLLFKTFPSSLVIFT
jgi:hypothetical protein